MRVRGWGKSGHAAMPEGTVNAIGLVADYLLDNGLCNDAAVSYTHLNQLLQPVRSKSLHPLGEAFIRKAVFRGM